MQQVITNTFIFRSLMSCGIIASNLSAIKTLPVYAQSSASERIECIRKFSEFYYSREGGDLSRKLALEKAEQTCAEQSNQNNAQPNNSNNNLGGSVNKPSGSPVAIADCIKKLMNERQAVCTRSRCASLNTPEQNASDNFGGWEWQTVRTSISENAAVQACQNAR